jgi:hypothetical protein
MRIGLTLRQGQEAPLAQQAEEHGFFGVLAGYDDPPAAMNAAVYASARTSAITIVVRVALGCEHPVTVAEEIAVLDNINSGRTVVLADTATLTADAATEEIEIVRRALACRPLRYRGERFNVPAGIPTNSDAGESISVTPKPTQVEVPIWMMGDSGKDVAACQGLPVIAMRMSDCDSERLVQPAVATVTGQMDADREVASSWASAGATHLLVRLPADLDTSCLLSTIARFIVPEVAMPDYPRIVSEASPPLPWPPSVSGSDEVELP